MWVDEVNSLGRPQLNLGADHPADLGHPGSGGVHDHPGAGLRMRAVGRPVADPYYLAAVAKQLRDARVVEGASAVRDGVLDVRVDQPVGIYAPFLERHRTDEIAGEAWLGAPGLLGGETHMRVGLLQRLETVVHLHRGLHPFDVVPVVGKDRDRKSTRLNSSHSQISYAVFCLKKKKT